ncbi:Mog1p/PsbP-like protein [Massarina eburnea CBS 473.64]|uniref:Mog1p/PsbP-like protein n=1 Tax=Massarina eburnea CBS 473.64 TaxID=1395130 RepID=A0A6A6S2H5_9PLEO|nr:Mog1p/PsbP-like protein [Massarina eburnea CBS 473.64]
MAFKQTALFGGAITVDLPTVFGDTSQIRQVPDHQEVFLDINGYSGAIIEILEYVDKPTDEEALQYHFADLVDGTGDATNLLGQGRATMVKVPNHPVLSLHFIQTPPAPDRPNRKTADFVAIHLILLRLKDQGTDIMITINSPHYPGEYEKPAQEGELTQLMTDAEVVKERILQTFEISDWGLFQG